MLAAAYTRVLTYVRAEVESAGADTVPQNPPVLLCLEYGDHEREDIRRDARREKQDEPAAEATRAVRTQREDDQPVDREPDHHAGKRLIDLAEGRSHDPCR